MNKYWYWPSASSKWGKFDADYPGRSECPLCHGTYDCVQGNWLARVKDVSPPQYTDSLGHIPLGYDRTDVCYNCGLLVNKLAALPTWFVKALVRRAGKSG
jgi:hypothetical protein